MIGVAIRQHASWTTSHLGLTRSLSLGKLNKNLGVGAIRGDVLVQYEGHPPRPLYQGMILAASPVPLKLIAEKGAFFAYTYG